VSVQGKRVTKAKADALIKAVAELVESEDVSRYNAELAERGIDLLGTLYQAAHSARELRGLAPHKHVTIRKRAN
jgi:hypothetical protein